MFLKLFRDQKNIELFILLKNFNIQYIVLFLAINIAQKCGLPR